MAGVKGRSGGPRANSGGARANSGGARPGAGRKPAPKTHDLATPQPSAPAEPVVIEDPLEWLRAAMKNPLLDDKLRIDAAKALLPFVHTKKGEGGKKDEVLDAAKKAGKGRFAAAPAPLRMVK